MLVFVEGGKPEKNPRSKARINNKLNPLIETCPNSCSLDGKTFPGVKER